jgi:hypothetical protein
MITSFTPRLGLSTLALVGLAALAGVSISAPTAEEVHKILPPMQDIVTPRRACSPSGGPVAEGDEENQLLRVPVPARDHSSSNMALPPVHPQLA